MDIKSPVAEARNEYLYTASGVKLRVTTKWKSDYSTTPVIGSTVNTGELDMLKTTDYVGNKIYENDILKKILVDGGYRENGAYYFYQKDHLGNNVMVLDRNGRTIQREYYYSFGMTMPEIWGDGNAPYKYNGKELDLMHGLNLYDYHARQYDGPLGRFTTMDPHAENYFSWSPYAYCANNPIRITDPTGKDWRDFLNSADEGALNAVASALTSSPIGIGVSAYNLSQASPEVQEETLKGMAEGAYKTSVPGYIETAVNEYKSGGDGSITGNLTGKILAETTIIYATAKPVVPLMRVSRVASNPVPKNLARVIPAEIESTTLGAKGARDVFVTAAKDIKGLNASQIAKRLTIPENAKGFKVIKFKTPTNGISSPIKRSNPGFVGKGKTKGGAREFTIPNQKIPKDAKIKIVK